jgi:cold shock CspA family protein
MAQGFITKIVTSFGSKWGRIRPRGASREVFFNAASLENAIAFSSVEVGQEVEFNELPDQVNGTRAVHVILVASRGVESSGAPL